ncbi:MAG: hypothetical protein KF801_05905 [Cryobacterium sp.]|nr:hypothetical protein [Cryobacterium sp.]
MTRWARVARGTVAAAVSLFIAAFSHSLAGGSLPGFAGIALCLTFSVLACIALAGRRMPRTRLAASIVASQAMYHWLFGSLGASTLATAPTLGHVHNAPVDFGSVSPHAHSGTDMLVAHIAAAVATFTLLACGERAIAAISHWAFAVARALFPSVEGTVGNRVPSTLSPTGVPRVPAASQRVDHSGLRYRGPPSLLSA